MLRDAKTASDQKGSHVVAMPKQTRHSLQQTDENESQTSSVELLRFVDDDNEGDNDNELELELTKDEGDGDGERGREKQTLDTLTLNDQVRLLSKQLNALMTRRREDYEMLEHNLRKSLRLTTDAANVDADMRSELEQLRREVQALRDAQSSANKERLTVEWLQQSISEIRKQLVELQRTAGTVAKDMQVRSTGYEDLATIRNDFQQIKLELAAQRERQQQNEVLVQELREELLQQEEDYRRLLNKQEQQKQEKHNHSASVEEDSASQEVESSSDMMADHKRRHCRFQHQQIHELQLSQRSLRRQVNELKYHRIDERVRSLELEQHRIANANFNLSRQIASLDKLHTSMLELLEDVEGLQTKMDKNIPELRHEISKLEFANAQISSEQNMVREEVKNAARSLQAMAVSVSALQDEREGVKKLMGTVEQLQTSVDRVQSLVNAELSNKLSHANKPHKRAHHQMQQQQHEPHTSDLSLDDNVDSALAETLVAELENVEAQYEAIINKLPHDCSDVSTPADGLHLIAPAGQHHPLMTHCTADGWTTVQQRFDGSADFNRSWADYAHGFGMPGGEFWIGNEQLHHLTLNNCTQLRVHMQDIYDNIWVADYANFYISSRADGYRLHIGDYSGNASDALNYQQGMQFSAIDDDRDISQTHCAANYEGGWWFSHCQHANLNGRYNLGLTWFDAGRNEWIAVKSSQMLVKRRPSAECAASLTILSGQDTSTTTETATSVTSPGLATTSTTVVQFVAAAQA
ncbi:protein scabrous [Scaptodrosophila lebanonensis]|uniref:Protein scabrous n=1 Tax=Drosophila lebanonensis TaxID=7225 RepID=A0A6J2UG40_DROLE|nr:protein scabrous [Scaptodrosophila lebanonensis]